MEQPFHEAIRKARFESQYPRLCDFVRVSRVSHDTYVQYESGLRLPKLQSLNRIILHSGISEQTAKKLREIHAISLARRLGVEMRQLPPGLKASELAEKIQREVEYELKRVGTSITGNTSRVCARRIEILLKDALRIP